ncbi:transposase [Clostridium sp. WILCCON 0269]|uniref:Transposase n=1 Tax=Candidatus Clostridium eludens TaxID=3381663 RepID=A0ABW8SQ92_9CLOT
MRKSKWDDVKENLILVEGWARDGLTNEQIAHNLGINADTLYEYKKKYSEFSEALKKGKEVVDLAVENALLKSALGFEYEEEVVTNKGDVVTVRRFERPSVTAQIFWLKNRKPAVWRDKQELAVSNNNIVVTLEDDVLLSEFEEFDKEA